MGKIQTNADYIRSMSDEELAAYILNFKNTYGEEYEGESSFLDWLQEEKENTGRLTVRSKNAEKGNMRLAPCGIGTDIYYIPSEKNFRLNLLDGHGEENRVFHQTVDRITFRKNGWYMECDSDLEYGTGRILLDTSYGVTWFLTSEEAEAKLKEMEGESDVL